MHILRFTNPHMVISLPWWIVDGGNNNHRALEKSPVSKVGYPQEILTLWSPTGEKGYIYTRLSSGTNTADQLNVKWERHSFPSTRVTVTSSNLLTTSTQTLPETSAFNSKVPKFTIPSYDQPDQQCPFSSPQATNSPCKPLLFACPPRRVHCIGS